MYTHITCAYVARDATTALSTDPRAFFSTPVLLNPFEKHGGRESVNQQHTRGIYSICQIIKSGIDPRASQSVKFREIP